MKRKFNIDKLLALFAFVISVCTLYVFFYQTSLMKKQQYTSVLPFLSISNTLVDQDYAFILKNDGIGPAFIEEINIRYKDTVYHNKDINDFFVEVIAKEDTLFANIPITHATIRKGMLIPEKEVKYMLQLDHKVKNFKNRQIALRDWLNNKIRVEVKYASIYEEKWKIIYPIDETPIKIK